MGAQASVEPHLEELERELGLADRVGNYVDAIEMAAGISGIDPVEAVATIIEPPDRRGFMERFLFGDASATDPFRLFGRKFVLSFLP